MAFQLFWSAAFELMKPSYSLIIITVGTRLAWYDTLGKTYTTVDYQHFIELVATEIETSLALFKYSIKTAFSYVTENHIINKEVLLLIDIISKL